MHTCTMLIECPACLHVQRVTMTTENIMTVVVHEYACKKCGASSRLDFHFCDLHYTPNTQYVLPEATLFTELITDLRSQFISNYYAKELIDITCLLYATVVYLYNRNVDILDLLFEEDVDWAMIKQTLDNSLEKIIFTKELKNVGNTNHDH